MSHTVSRRVVAVLALLSAAALPVGVAGAQVQQPAFVCNNDLFFVYNEGEGPGTETHATVARLVLTGDTTSFVPFAGPLPHGLNALGYNTADNYLYGVGFNGSPEQGATSAHLYRIGGDGSVVDLGLTTGADPSLIYTSGTFIEPNRLLVSTGTSFDPAVYQVIDIPTNSVVKTMIPDSDSRAFDWATNPFDQQVYGMLQPDKRLATIDVDTAVLTPFGAVATDGPPMGSAWFLNSGQMLLFGKPAGGTFQNTLFRADVGVNRNGTGALTAIGSGPSAFDTDGASCVTLPPPPTTTTVTTTVTTTTTVPSTTTTTRSVPTPVPVPPRFAG